MKNDYHIGVDWTSQFSITNLVSKFSLYCTSKVYIILFGMCLFTGTLIYIAVFSRYLDIIGRKVCMLTSLCINILLLILIILCPPHLYLMYLLLILYGISASTLSVSSAVFCAEFIPKQYSSTALLLSNFGKSSSLILGCFFFFLVS